MSKIQVKYKIPVIFAHIDLDLEEELEKILKMRNWGRVRYVDSLKQKNQDFGRMIEMAWYRRMFDVLMKPDHISGLEKLSLLRGNVDGKERRIILFYDIHMERYCSLDKKRAVMSSEVILSLLKSDIFIYLYLEVLPYLSELAEKIAPKGYVRGEKIAAFLQQLREDPKINMYAHGQLDVLRNKLFKCYQPPFENCPDNRVHFTDIREATIALDVIYKYADIETFTNKLFKGRKINKEIYVDVMMDFIENFPFILKEWKRGPFKETWREHVRYIINLIADKPDFRFIFEMNMNFGVEEWMSPLMDVYLLGRLFKRFRDRHHPNAKNAVIYVGTDHAKIYKKYLTDYLHFERIYDTDSFPSTMCVDTRDMKYGFNQFFEEKHIEAM